MWTSADSLERLVRVYQRRNKPNLDGLLEGVERLASLEDAVRIAASSVLPDGKRHPHQRRMEQEVLHVAANVLNSAVVEIANCTSFDDLLRLIIRKTDGIGGFGELAQYDTALRIGAFLWIYPSKVYLHAGARSGARALGFGRQNGRPGGNQTARPPANPHAL